MGRLRTAADNISVGTPTRHTVGTDGTRPEHGALACRKYDLLASTGTAVDPSGARYLGSEDGHEATSRGFTEIGYVPESRVKFKSNQ